MSTDVDLARRLTRRTYDRVAEAYEGKWRERGSLLPYLDAFAALVPGAGPVLDVGCGPGFDSQLLRQRGLQVIGVDISWQMLRVATERYPGTYVQADMLALPFTRPAAGIWANASLLHLSHKAAERTLRVLAGFLRPGGPLFLTLKAGDGEVCDCTAWGPDNPRYVALWDAGRLDATLVAAGYRLLDSETETGKQADWLVRLAVAERSAAARRNITTVEAN